MKMALVGRTVLANKEANIYNFEMKTPTGNKVISEEPFSSSIAVALDVISDTLGVERIPVGKTVRITVEEV